MFIVRGSFYLSYVLDLLFPEIAKLLSFSTVGATAGCRCKVLASLQGWLRDAHDSVGVGTWWRSRSYMQQKKRALDIATQEYVLRSEVYACAGIIHVHACAEYVTICEDSVKLFPCCFVLVICTWNCSTFCVSKMCSVYSLLVTFSLVAIAVMLLISASFNKRSKTHPKHIQNTSKS